VHVKYSLSSGLSGSLRLTAEDYTGLSDDNTPNGDDEDDDGWDLDDFDDMDEMDRSTDSADAVDSKQQGVVPTNNDVLLIVIGVVVGVAVISMILIVVACVWRQRQQRLHRTDSKLLTLLCSKNWHIYYKDCFLSSLVQLHEGLTFALACDLICGIDSWCLEVPVFTTRQFIATSTI
jgi:hypothetical protein